MNVVQTQTTCHVPDDLFTIDPQVFRQTELGLVGLYQISTNPREPDFLPPRAVLHTEGLLRRRPWQLRSGREQRPERLRPDTSSLPDFSVALCINKCTQLI